MRDASGKEAGGQRGMAVVTDEQFDDKTKTVSVATLLTLAERSAKHPSDAPGARITTPAPAPTFFEKSGAVLVVAQREPEPRPPEREASGSEPHLVSRITPARPKVGSIAAILHSASARARELTKKNRASARSSTGRWLAACVCALLALVVVGGSWRWNVGGVRDRVAARVPAVRALLDWGKALLPE